MRRVMLYLIGAVMHYVSMGSLYAHDPAKVSPTDFGDRRGE